MLFSRLWAFERGILWALDVDGSADREQAPPVLMAFGEATREDVASLAAAMGLGNPDDVRERMASGRRCFVARLEGTIAAYGWVSVGTESIGELERTLRMDPGEAYIWDCATLPLYRRRGVYGALLRFMVSTLRQEGMRRLWIGASQDNTPSLRGFAAAGFQPVLKLMYLRVAGLRRDWLVGDTNAPAALVADARRALAESPQMARTTPEAEAQAW